MSTDWMDRLVAALDSRRLLQCVECGRLDDGVERGWTLHAGDDDGPQAFCPDCDDNLPAARN